jgi:LPS-assembly lipoprotein
MKNRLTRRHLLSLIPVSAVAGCGFQPIYMPTATGQPGPAQRELAAVNVDIIPDRPGQLLRQALQERLASDSGARHRYDLKVVFWIAGEGIAIQSDNSASRVRLIGHANWTLTTLTSPRIQITTGTGRATDGFNVFHSQYFASDLDNEEATRRLTRELADQVVMQLAMWFRQRAGSTG